VADSQGSDPQLLSKVLRTKLGLSWEPHWDTPAPRGDSMTADANAWRPPATLDPINRGVANGPFGPQDLTNPTVRVRLGLPPLVM
jgi:hypothetical protein